MIEWKKIRIAIVPGILTLVLIAEVSGYVTVSHRFAALSGQIRSALRDLSVYLRDPAKAPSKKQLEQITDYRSRLQEVMKHTLYTYKSKADLDPPMKVLEFKEKLTELSENYNRLIPIPTDIGFKEYWGGTVPQPSEMKRLSRQLSFIVQVIDLLIENNVETIGEIKRMTVEEIQSTLEPEPLFMAYHFRFSFKIGYKNFLNFWNEVLNLTELVKVKDLKLKSNFKPGDTSLEAQLVTAEMHFCLLEYSE
jgi:hypothetical protein